MPDTLFIELFLYLSLRTKNPSWQMSFHVYDVRYIGRHNVVQGGLQNII